MFNYDNQTWESWILILIAKNNEALKGYFVKTVISKNKVKPYEVVEKSFTSLTKYGAAINEVDIVIYDENNKILARSSMLNPGVEYNKKHIVSFTKEKYNSKDTKVFYDNIIQTGGGSESDIETDTTLNK